MIRAAIVAHWFIIPLAVAAATACLSFTTGIRLSRVFLLMTLMSSLFRFGG